MEPREWVLPTPPTNDEVAMSKAAAAASNPPPEIPADQQTGKIQLRSWQLYTPEAPVLDLRGKKVTLTLDLANTFMS